MLQNASPPTLVFCSYAPADEPWCLELEKHLSLLRRQGLIATWHRRDIAPGTDWTKAIDEHLGTASVILLLISPDFFASDYCYGLELQRAMERHDASEARVIPVLLRPVADWKEAPFAQLAVLPTNAQPITTWPNRDEAWADVVAGIRRATKELPRLTVSTHHTSRSAVWNIPYPRNPVFTGREELLERLAKSLRVVATSRPQAISGLGGIGKTQLVVEYAYRHRSDYKAVLWARADTRKGLISAFVAIAGLLNLPEQDAQEQMIAVHAVKVWLQEHTGWLLILDNADDLVIIPEFLPPTYDGHVLLTTREQAMVRLAQRIEVNQLPPDAGALLLLRRAGLLTPEAGLDQAAPHDREVAMQITEELGGLPLALDQAGAYIEETGCNLVDYQHLYQRHHRELLKERRGLLTHHPDVATTVSLAFKRVEQMQPAAAELLRLCAFLAPDTIPEEIITKGATYLGPVLGPVAADTFLLNPAIGVLLASSLMQRDSRGKTLSVHRLVQVVLRDAMSAEETRQWAERTVYLVHAAFPEIKFETQDQCKRLLPQVFACLDLINLYTFHFPVAGSLMHRAGWYLYDHGRNSEAEPLLRQALAIEELVVPAESIEIASILNNLANLYRDQDQYGEAERLYQRALAIREQVLGPLHPETAIILANLANLYRDQDQYGEAERLYQRALAIREQILSAETTALLNNLALLYRVQGRYGEIAPLLQRARTIEEMVLSPEHPEVAITLDNLATLYRLQGRYSEAERFYQAALTILERMQGPEHPKTAITLNNLAILYRDQGRYSEAEPLFQQALVIREQGRGPEHPETAITLDNLATLYRDQGRYSEAEPLYQHALAIFKRMTGPQHPEPAITLDNLATLYRDQGRYSEAEPLYQHALSIREQVLGSEHPETATTLNNLATMYRDQGRYEQAESLYWRALTIQEQRLGSQHPYTLSVRRNYASLLRTLGREADAQLEAPPSTPSPDHETE